MTAHGPTPLSPVQLLDLHDSAADWCLRRQQPGWTGADERALDAWLAADPRHRSTFDGMNRTWLDAAQLQQHYPQAYGRPGPQADGMAPAAGPAKAPPSARRAGPPLARSPAFACAAVLACTLLAAGGWYRWDNTARYALDASTAPGETRNLALPDGTHVALNVASSLSVRYYPRRREVALDSGEAFFEVAADAAQPFTVDAGRSQVRVVGTAFNVRAVPSRLVVKVLEGRVEVRPDRAARGGPVLVLGPESGVAVDAATGAHHSVAASAASVGGWRRGQIQFSRTPLAEVLDEVARYLGQPVALASPSLGALPVSGFLSTETPERFLQALPELMPVQVQRQPDASWRVTARR